MSKDNRKGVSGSNDAAAAVAGEEPAAAEAAPAPPDPTVLLYLKAATNAFPRVQRYLTQQIQEDVRTTEFNKLLSANLEGSISGIVEADIKERQEMERTVKQLKLRKVELEGDIAQRQKFFNEQHSRLDVENAEALEKLRRQIHLLEADAREAEAWRASRDTELSTLRDIETRFADFQVRAEQQLTELYQENEEERRKLRDLLVRKLRRVRDIMSSTTDDDADAGPSSASLQSSRKASTMPSGGMLARDAASAATVAMFQTPTAKLNEKLSRAVTMYERESKTIAESITQIHSVTKQSLEQLSEQRAHNEKLVLRNASQVKAKEMLTAQLEELRHKYKKLSETQETHEVERRRALQETVRMQGDVVADLRGELHHHITEYEEASQELKSLERQIRLRHQQAQDAGRFFLSLVNATPQAEAPDPLSSAQPPPSGFVSHSSSGGEYVAHKQEPSRSFTEMTRTDLPGIPALGLFDGRDVASFFAALLQT